MNLRFRDLAEEGQNGGSKMGSKFNNGLKLDLKCDNVYPRIHNNRTNFTQKSHPIINMFSLNVRETVNDRNK